MIRRASLAAQVTIWLAVLVYAACDFWFFRFEAYFDVGAVHVESGPRGEITLTATGTARRDFIGSYKVIGRSLSGRKGECEGIESGPIPYQKGGAYPEPPITMHWWEGPGGTCRDLPPGIYTIETCWTVRRPSPLREVVGCVESNPFRVHPKGEKP
jgi:hypothetical protein